MFLSRRPDSSSNRPAQVASLPAASVADRTSAIDAMDFDTTNTSASASSHAVDVNRSSATHDSSTLAAKRQVTADSNTLERDDERSSKRRRQNSTNTESSSSSLLVPADRTPINASYSSMQRYRTRVTNCCIFRSTPKSRPNNMGISRPSLLYDFSREISRDL